ncbi:hypothetical protein D9M70_532220 [compost metagenome]
MDLDLDRAPPTAVVDGVLHEIGERPLQRRLISRHHDRSLIRLEGHLIAGAKSKGGECNDHPLCEDCEIDGSELVLLGIETFEVEQLACQN